MLLRSPPRNIQKYKVERIIVIVKRGRNIKMKRYPIVFTIAGSDCIGGNGAQADLKTITALGAYAATAITAITVGNTTGLKSLLPIPQETIKKQIETVMEDIRPDIVKLGLLNDIQTIQTVGDCLRKYYPKYVIYDPVMLNAEGFRYMLKENIGIIRKELLPFTNLIVMNCQEAELLCDIPIKTVEDMKKAAEIFTLNNNCTVLIKSGDRYEDELYDVLRTPAGKEWIFRSDMIYTRNSHGVSCTFSAAIATYLALGHNMENAVIHAREFVQQAILYGNDVKIARGQGPVCQTFAPVPMVKR